MMNTMDLTRDGIVRALTPSLEDQLADARCELTCAKMIDNTQRMLRETAYWRQRIREIESQMEARDAQ